MPRISRILLAALFSAIALVGQAPPSGAFVFAAGGDMIGPWRSLKAVDDPGFRRVASLFQQADLGFANQEGSIFDLSTFPGYPAAENGGGTPLSDPAVAADIRAMGIRMVSKANNHATDWGAEGLAATLKALASAGIVAAGAGMSDVEARAPAYLDTPKGTVALVSTASTFPPASVAGPAVDKRGVMSRPRPGISALHVRQVRLVSAAELATLRRIAGPLAFKAGANGGEVRIGDEYFRSVGAMVPHICPPRADVGFDCSPHNGITVEADPADTAAVLAAIREARRKAKFVVFAIHAHETAGNDDDMPPADFEPLILHRANEAPSPDDPRPAAFEPALFHAAIDAGADVVLRTGPHALNGIEIYHGKPIFYGLASLFLSFGGRRSYTAPGGQTKNFPAAWFESVVPVTTFQEGRLAEIKLYPVTIESSAAATDGLPQPAEGEAARRILERLKTLSAPFGTVLSVEGNVGIVRPEPRTATDANRPN